MPSDTNNVDDLCCTLWYTPQGGEKMRPCHVHSPLSFGVQCFTIIVNAMADNKLRILSSPLIKSSPLSIPTPQTSISNSVHQFLQSARSRRIRLHNWAVKVITQTQFEAIPAFSSGVWDMGNVRFERDGTHCRRCRHCRCSCSL